MKKYLTIVVLMFVCILPVMAEGEGLDGAVQSLYSDGKNLVDTVYQDTKAGVKTIYSDLKSGTETIFPSVKEAIGSIAKSIGVAAEHVYGILVKKYIVIAVKELLFFIASILLLIIGWVGYNKRSKEKITYSIIPSVMCFCIGIIMFMCINFDNMLMGLINPEYGALNYILDYSKSLIK